MPEPINLAALAKLAEKATPGPWEAWSGRGDHGFVVSPGSGRSFVETLSSDDALLIAALDPDTARTLIRVVAEQDATVVALLAEFRQVDKILSDERGCPAYKPDPIIAATEAALAAARAAVALPEEAPRAR